MTARVRSGPAALRQRLERRAPARPRARGAQHAAGAKPSGGEGDDHTPRRWALSLLLPLVMVGLALVTLAFLGVFPVRAYLDQRRDIAAAEERAAVLREENDKLAAQAKALGSDEGVEQLAREHFGLVLPGEEAFIVTFDAPADAGGAGALDAGAEGAARSDPDDKPWVVRTWKAMVDLL